MQTCQYRQRAGGEESGEEEQQKSNSILKCHNETEYFEC